MTFVALFFNQFLPSTIGADVIRIWDASRSGLALRVAFGSVLLERLAHLAGLSLIAAVGATVWGTARLPGAMLWTLWAVFAVASIAISVIAMGVRMPGLRLFDSLRVHWLDLGAHTRKLFSAPVPCAAIFALVFTGQTILALATIVLAVSLDIPIRFVDCMALLPAVVLVSSLPVSVSGWGVREYAIVTVFGYAGLAAPGAFALSLILGLFTILAVIPGGIVWLVRRSPAGDKMHPSK